MLSSKRSSKLLVACCESESLVAQAESGEQAPQAAPQEFSLKKGISIPESLQILNMTREEVNPASLSEVRISTSGYQ